MNILGASKWAFSGGGGGALLTPTILQHLYVNGLSSRCQDCKDLVQFKRVPTR